MNKKSNLNDPSLFGKKYLYFTVKVPFNLSTEMKENVEKLY